MRRRFHHGFLLHNVERNSFRKRMQQHEKNRQKKKNVYLFIFIFFFFCGGGGGGGVAWVRRIYEKLCLESPRVANLGRCHAYLGCRNMLLRDFHLPLFVTDKWVKCYCELILGLASLDCRQDCRIASENIFSPILPQKYIKYFINFKQKYLFMTFFLLSN